MKLIRTVVVKNQLRLYSNNHFNTFHKLNKLKDEIKQFKDDSVENLVKSGTKEAIKILKNVSETMHKEENIETTVGFNVGIFFVSFTHTNSNSNSKNINKHT